MRIQHNIMAMNAYRNYTNNVSAMQKNLEKLSSGYKINRAGDDAAGLAISEKMRAQITGLETAQKNAKDGISLVQTAEGALTEVHDMLNRMVELATQSANGTYDNTTDRAQMQKEVDQLLDEIDRIADSSNFNGINLLDGTLGMNTDAFEVTGTADAVEAVTGGTISPVSVSDIHGGDSTAFQNAQFVIDLKGIKGSNGANGVYQIKVAGATLEAKITTANNAATKTDIGGAFQTQYTGTDAQHTVTIGGQGFKVTHAGGKLTFQAVNSTGAALTEISASKAAAVNEKLAGATVEVVGKGSTVVSTPLDYDHAIQNVQLAQASVSGGWYGADIDLSKIVGDGNKLTIGTATFTFKMTAADSTITSSKTIKLDSRKSKDEQIADAVRIMASSGQFPSTMHISAKDGKTIHVDAAASDSYASKPAFASAIKAVVASAPAKNAGVQLKVTASAIASGNTISVTDGSKTVKFVYGKGTSTGSVKYYTDKSASGLKTAIGAAFGASNVELSGDTITIRAAASTTGAPTILGKGLTLQIADTSAPYNQLNVAVQDCHTDSMGIGGLKINTEESAQAALDKIRSAINYVSDVRGTLGATQNRLDHTINNLSVMTENIQDAESTIRDVDVAEEMMAYTKNNILIQSAQAMLAQANQVPQGVLQLLQ